MTVGDLKKALAAYCLASSSEGDASEVVVVIVDSTFACYYHFTCADGAIDHPFDCSHFSIQAQYDPPVRKQLPAGQWIVKR